MTRVDLADGAAVTFDVGPDTAVAIFPSVPATIDFRTLDDIVQSSTDSVPGLVFTAAPLDVAGGGSGSDQGQVVAGKLEFRQRTPSASWYFPHNLGRTPSVELYVHDGGTTDDDLELVEADPEARPTYVAVMWPVPMTGLVLLS